MSERNILDLSQELLREVTATVASVQEHALEALVGELEAANKVFCVGAGRSGILLQAFCMRLNHLGFDAYMAGGLPCPPVGAGDLIVVASGSGETRSVAAIVGQGRAAGARVAMFTAREPASVAIDADLVVHIAAPTLLINAGVPSSLQPMRTLFEQSVFVLCESVVWGLKAKNGIGEEEMAARHANLE
jgi:6-phospho-3-hexuloisomerase